MLVFYHIVISKGFKNLFHVAFFLYVSAFALKTVIWLLAI